MNDVVRKRNEKSLEELARDLTLKVDEVTRSLEVMKIAVNSCVTRTIELERMVHTHIASSIGRGPTKR